MIRHGESVANATGIIAGHQDSVSAVVFESVSVDSRRSVRELKLHCALEWGYKGELG
jgi:broad specificity phosphatase PhoE